MHSRSLFGLGIALTLCSLPAWAASTTPIAQHPAQVTLSLEQDYSVPQTEMQAQLSAEATATSAADAAAKVNRQLAWAQQRLAANPSLHWHSVGYQTQKDHDGKWMVQGEIAVEGAPNVLSATLGTLQSRLLLTALDFTTSAADRDAAEARARRSVLSQFVQEAHAACHALSLGWSGVDRVQLRTGGLPGPVVPVMMAARVNTVPQPVTTQAGVSRGRVYLDGTAFCTQ